MKILLQVGDMEVPISTKCPITTNAIRKNFKLSKRNSLLFFFPIRCCFLSFDLPDMDRANFNTTYCFLSTNE